MGEIDNYSLVELIIETGIHDAIAKKLNEKGKLSNNAVAEGIINNVRKTIIRDQLTDPRFYEKMSKLLDDLIKQQRDDTASYEEFLQKAEALAKKTKDLIEYVLVHEMVHLLEPTHNNRFISLLDGFYPSWREARVEINELPVLG